MFDEDLTDHIQIIFWIFAHPISLTIVPAKEAASLEVLIRPLPHYGRQSYIAFDGREALEKVIWPMRVQQVAVVNDGVKRYQISRQKCTS